ncbi:MAG: hypothetical protein O3A95_06255 [Planctomycetota bacterium]|nr:hypothetical protein [Planctomycetota bacterium]MDA1113885.1 hypothetical protein [Planctomycetota bacterium]
MLLTFLHAAFLTLAPAQAVADQDFAAVNSTAGTAAAPTILFVLPAEGETLDPVVIIGTNFGDLPLPFFGFIPSAPLFTKSLRIPFLGRVSVLVTGVPPTFFPGRVDLTVLANFQTSNAVDFRIL